MNLVHLTGHLVQNPELKTIGERVVLDGTIAHNHIYKDRAGERQEDVVFITFEAWNALAETMCRYLTTKRRFLLSGRLKLNRWEDEKGRHAQVVLVAEHMEFMDAPSKATPEEAQPAAAGSSGA